MRMAFSRRWIANLGLCAALATAGAWGAGCSHAPKAVAEPAPPPAKPAAHAAAHPTHKAVAPDEGVVAGSSSTAASDSSQKAPVVPKLTPAQAKEMELLSKNNVDAAQTLLNTVDPAKLDVDHKQKYEIAKGMLDDAITARAQEDWMKAAQLSTKAKVLAEQLTAP